MKHGGQDYGTKESKFWHEIKISIWESSKLQKISQNFKDERVKNVDIKSKCP